MSSYIHPHHDVHVHNLAWLPTG